MRRSLGSQTLVDLFRFNLFPVFATSLLSTKPTNFYVYTRRLNTTDLTQPELTRIGDANVYVNLYDKYVEPGVVATDNLDGVIDSEQIIQNVRQSS